ncbi:MAG: DUF2207 domain-containing protein [candidate division WOR-3 bacterium]
MKRIGLIWLLILPSAILAKSYYYPEIVTEIYFTADGNARIIQDRTYPFEGSFSWAFIDLKKSGAKDIIFNQLLEKTAAGWQELEPLELANRSQSLYIHWGYSAQDEIKTFRLDYTIIGAVKRFQDVAEFYWKVIEDEHEKIDRITIKLFLPQPSPELFKVYIHSRAQPGTLTFNEPKDQVLIEQKGIPKDAFVEVRMLTAPAIFPLVEPQAKNRYQAILKEEKRNFVVSSIRKFVFIPLGLLLMIVLPIAILLLFYFRYGREPKIDYQAIYEHEPPRPAPPVVLPVIFHQKPHKSAMYQPIFQGMLATLLDLAVKGLVSVKEVGQGNKRHYAFTLEKPESLRLDGIVSQIINFFFGEVSGGEKTFSDEAVKKYIKDHPTKTQSILSDLFGQALNWWQKELGRDLLDLRSSNAYNTFFLYLIPTLAIGVFLLISGLGALFSLPNPISFILPIMSAIGLIVIFAIAGRSILRWSPKAYLEQKRWLNFRKFLIDFSAIEQAPITLLPIWEQYYVYAVALGVAQRFLQNVIRLAEQKEVSLALPAWYIATTTGPTTQASFTDSLSSFQSALGGFANNLSNMVSSFSTATSSGGGFSGGGGGGGGGGSSGAG